MNFSSDIGYRGATACVAAGISYRQLDYWARTGLVEPGVRGAAGSGSQRLYSFRDILVLKIVKRLLDTGVSLQNIRTAVEHLRVRGGAELLRDPAQAAAPRAVLGHSRRHHPARDHDRRRCNNRRAVQLGSVFLRGVPHLHRHQDDPVRRQGI